MSDQNIINLMSTLLGGFLTIVGGFAGSYLIQSLSNRTQKRKEIRSLIENLYRDTQNLFYLFARVERSRIFGVMNMEEATEIMRLFTEYQVSIQTTVMLYLTPLKSEYGKYSNGLNAYTKEMMSYVQNGVPLEFDEIVKVIATFQAHIQIFLEKKGYNYY